MLLNLRRVAITAVLFLHRAAMAQDVTLTSQDGLITLHGTLQSYDGEFFRVDTAYGLLTLDGQGVLCEGPGCPELTAFVADITIAGSVGIGDTLMPALVEGFALSRGYGIRREVISDTAFSYVLFDPTKGQDLARLRFRLSNSDQALADLQAGTADLALSMRNLRGLPGTAQVIGFDALVPLVAQDNPLRTITLPDLAAVLAGTTTNWSALGGIDAPIVLHALEAGAGLQQALEDALLAPLSLTLAADVQRHPTVAALAAAVAADPFALGVGAASSIGNAAALALTGACGAILQADAMTIRTRDYPLTAGFYLYAPDRRLPLVIRDLFDWISSPAAQRHVREAGFVDTTTGRIGVNAQGARLALAIGPVGAAVDLPDLQRLVAGIGRADRLTPTFRFDASGRTLDPASRSTLIAFARALESGSYDGQTLIFTGFSDGGGDAGANLRLSQTRAEAVRDAVLGNAPLYNPDRVTLEVAAYGEALPMACDDTVWGRQTNRRVEVWARRD